MAAPSWRALKQAADVAFNAEQYQASSALYDAAARATDDEGRSAFELARLHAGSSAALQALRSWDGAVRAASRAVEADQGCDTGWYQLGTSLLGLGSAVAARRALQTGLQLSPGSKPMQDALLAALMVEEGQEGNAGDGGVTSDPPSPAPSLAPRRAPSFTSVAKASIGTGRTAKPLAASAAARIAASRPDRGASPARAAVPRPDRASNSSPAEGRSEGGVATGRKGDEAGQGTPAGDAEEASAADSLAKGFQELCPELRRQREAEAAAKQAGQRGPPPPVAGGTPPGPAPLPEVSRQPVGERTGLAAACDRGLKRSRTRSSSATSLGAASLGESGETQATAGPTSPEARCQEGAHRSPEDGGGGDGAASALSSGATPGSTTRPSQTPPPGTSTCPPPAEAVASTGSNSTGPRELATAAFKAGRYDEAARLYREASGAHPDDLSTLSNLAAAELMRRAFPAALDACEAAIRVGREAVAAGHPPRPARRVLDRAARAAACLGMWERARTYASRADEALTAEGGSAPRAASRADLPPRSPEGGPAEGECKEGPTQRAVASLQRSLDSSARALTDRDYSLALEHADLAASHVSPTAEEAIRLRVEALMGLARGREAVAEAALASVRGDREAPAALALRAAAAASAGDLAAAEHLATRAVELGDSSGRAARVLVALRGFRRRTAVAQAAERRGAADEATASYEGALKAAGVLEGYGSLGKVGGASWEAAEEEEEREQERGAAAEAAGSGAAAAAAAPAGTEGGAAPPLSSSGESVPGVGSAGEESPGEAGDAAEAEKHGSRATAGRPAPDARPCAPLRLGGAAVGRVATSLSAARLRAGDAAGAHEAAAAARVADPSSTAARRALADALAGLGRWEEAAREWGAANGRAGGGAARRAAGARERPGSSDGFARPDGFADGPFARDGRGAGRGAGLPSGAGTSPRPAGPRPDPTLPESSATTDYYLLLSISTSSSQEEVRKAYRRAALKEHPDKAPEGGRAEAEKRFKLVGEAFAVLSDPQRRRRYDMDRRQRRLHEELVRASPGASFGPGEAYGAGAAAHDPGAAAARSYGAPFGASFGVPHAFARAPPPGAPGPFPSPSVYWSSRRTAARGGPRPEPGLGRSPGREADVWRTAAHHAGADWDETDQDPGATSRFHPRPGGPADFQASRVFADLFREGVDKVPKPPGPEARAPRPRSHI